MSPVKITAAASGRGLGGSAAGRRASRGPARRASRSRCTGCRPSTRGARVAGDAAGLTTWPGAARRASRPGCARPRRREGRAAHEVGQQAEPSPACGVTTGATPRGSRSRCPRRGRRRESRPGAPSWSWPAACRRAACRAMHRGGEDGDAAGPVRRVPRPRAGARRRSPAASRCGAMITVRPLSSVRTTMGGSTSDAAGPASGGSSSRASRRRPRRRAGPARARRPAMRARRERCGRSLGVLLVGGGGGGRGAGAFSWV